MANQEADAEGIRRVAGEVQGESLKVFENVYKSKGNSADEGEDNNKTSDADFEDVKDKDKK